MIEKNDKENSLKDIKDRTSSMTGYTSEEESHVVWETG